MSDSILQLYPTPGREVALRGLYLGHDLRQQATDNGRAFVYSNYIFSLDGRIAIPHPSGKGMVVPEQIANPRDWRLFQELAVQADILITSGRYLRDYADGRAQEILRVYDDPTFADLKEWRERHNLPTQPALAVISGSLNFPIPEPLTRGDRTVLVFTVESADPDRIRTLEGQMAQVFAAGKSGVEGQRLIEILVDKGYRTVYNTTGPKVQHLLLADRAVDRLYLTSAHRVLGGQPFSSIVEGPLLDPPGDYHLRHLYLDPHALDGLGQTLATYDRVVPKP